MKELNGHLMSKNIIIGKIENGNFLSIKEDLIPLLLKRTGNFSLWLKERAIDSHRPSSRILRKMLRLTTSNDIEVVLKFNAVSLTDTYWFKPEGSNLKWEEAIKCTDYFSDLIIKGKIDLYEDYSDKPTFELTNIGSYEKCWKYDKRVKDWFMIKKQSEEECKSEMLAYEVCKLLKIPVAEYSLISDTLIKCKNFITNWNYNYESAYSIVGEDESIEENMLMLSSFNKSGILREYTMMKILDAIIMNVDRHTHNYGLIRNIETGEVISMSPMFDHNMCLTGNKCTLKDKSPKMFFDEVRYCLKYVDNLYIPSLKEDDFKLSENKDINRFLWNNYKEVRQLIGKKGDINYEVYK